MGGNLHRDPIGTAKKTPWMEQPAAELGLSLIHVICEHDDPDADDDVLSFWAAVKFVPRIGEELILQDGRRPVVE